MCFFSTKGNCAAVDSYAPNKTKGTHADGLEVDIAGSDLEHSAKDGQLYKVGHVENYRSKADASANVLSPAALFSRCFAYSHV